MLSPLKPLAGIRIRQAGLTAVLLGAAFVTTLHTANAASHSTIHAIGVENEYADVIKQIGGPYVDVTALLSNPNTDPHTFEASPRVASQLSKAQLIVQNGVGYDDWADKLIKAHATPSQKVINVQHLLKLPDDTWNPHLWYNVKTMPVVADAIAKQLSALMPSEAAVFKANATAFKASLAPWYNAIDSFKKAHPHTAVAVTEPVSDYLLEAMGISIKTPKGLQTAVMNGVDPSPQDVSTQNTLLSQHHVHAFVYNQQVTDSLTSSFLSNAHAHNIPVVSVYETMPVGYHYQSWMLAETNALERAVVNHTSTEQLHAESH